MKHNLTPFRSLGLTGFGLAVLAGFAATPALAHSAPVDTSACTAPQLSQPFLAWNDTSWYTPVPGETADNFDGGGWTLNDGAQLVSTQLQDGQTGSVLDLPAGASAVSPPMCVLSSDGTARTMVRNLVGDGVVGVKVSYAATNSFDRRHRVGSVGGGSTDWTLSDPINLHPNDSAGWQLVQFTLVARGGASEVQVYNFFVDPRMI
jgi:hypothetical protein